MNQKPYGVQAQPDYDSGPMDANKGRRDLVLKIFFFGGLVLSLYFLVRYSAEYSAYSKALSLYSSSPGCSLAFGAEAPSTSSPCTTTAERIARLDSSEVSYGIHYSVVVENESGQRETVRIDPGEAFYNGARVGNTVQVQRFAGKIMKLVDGPVDARTTNHPQWQIDDVKAGLWLSAGGGLVCAFVIVMFRRVFTTRSVDG